MTTNSRHIQLLLFFLLAFCHSQAQQKNVVFFIVDDLKPLLGAYDQSFIHSPNIDQLANQSAVFTQAYTQQATCGPSRISFLTGMRPDYTKVYDSHTYMRNVNPDILTIPQHFKNNSYQTVGMGKVFHMAKKDDPRSWTLPFTDEKDLPYSRETGPPVMKHYQLPEMKEIMAGLDDDEDEPDRDDLRKQNVYPATESLDLPDDAYSDGAMAVKSIKLLNKFKQEGGPFLLTVGFNKPHLPFIAPKKYWDLYDRESIQLAPYQKVAENSPPYAYHQSLELQNYSDIPSNLDIDHPLSEDKQRELIHAYYACISYVDAQIGKIIDELKSLDLYENTVIVLIGDHGWHLGDHGLWNKHTNFEQATRTTLIIHSAGMTERITNSSPVELLDVFPTLCDLTELPIPELLQGKSLGPIIRKEAESVKEIAISQYPRDNMMGYSARSSRYRYTEWHKENAIVNGEYDGKNIKAKELYDYEIDPLETKNLRDDPAYKDVLVEIRTNLQKVIKK